MYAYCMHEIDWAGWQGEDIPVVYKMVYCSTILLDDAITCDNARSAFASASDKLARCKQVSKRSVTKIRGVCCKSRCLASCFKTGIK